MEELVHSASTFSNFPPALIGGTRSRAVVSCALAAAVAGCGGGGKRQDAGEPSGQFSVAVVQAKFPAKQTLAKRSQMVIAVKNVDTKTIPNVAVTVKSFDQRRDDPNLADPSRPIFVVNRGPSGGDTAYVGTSALGPLKPGETKVFRWDVTAVRAGKYNLTYSVAAGLNGKAKAVLSGGGRPSGAFAGEISDKAPSAHVADDGKTIVQSD
jgi:hypothetical protein